MKIGKSEREVLRLIASGMSRQQAADELGIEKSNAQAQYSNSLRKVLTQEQRSAWHYHVAGASVSDIAAKLGIAECAVKMRLFLARIRIGRATRPVRDDDDDIHLSEADHIHCTRCHIRGHVAGDPERCITAASYATSRHPNRNLDYGGYDGDWRLDKERKMQARRAYEIKRAAARRAARSAALT